MRLFTAGSHVAKTAGMTPSELMEPPLKGILTFAVPTEMSATHSVRP